MVKSKEKKEQSSVDNLNETQRAWWNEISELEIELYGLPDQRIGQIAVPVNLEPDRLHLATRAPASIPAIEAGLQKCCTVDVANRIKYPKFTMDVEDKFIVIKPVEGRVVKNAAGKPVFVPKK